MINSDRKRQEKLQKEMGINPEELQRAEHYFELAQDYAERARVYILQSNLKNNLRDSVLSLRYFFETIERFNLSIFDSGFYERMGDNLLILHEDLTRCGFDYEAKLSGDLAKKCYDTSSLKRGIII